MQIQAALEYTDNLNKELSELRDEYYNKLTFSNCNYTLSSTEIPYLTKAYQNTNNLVCFTDKTGRILEWNTGLIEAFGIDNKFIIEKYIWNIFQYLPLTNEIRTKEMLKLRETFLSCILTKQKQQIQNSLIFCFFDNNSSNSKTNIIISLTENTETIVKFLFKRINE